MPIERIPDLLTHWKHRDTPFMRLKFPLFVDPRYNAEQDVEFNSEDIESVEETTRNLFLGGSHKITSVTLSNGRSYTLNGHFGQEIERARKN